VNYFGLGIWRRVSIYLNINKVYMPRLVTFCCVTFIIQERYVIVIFLPIPHHTSITAISNTSKNTPKSNINVTATTTSAIEGKSTWKHISLFLLCQAENKRTQIKKIYPFIFISFCSSVLFINFLGCFLFYQH